MSERAELWDALSQALGYEPATDGERKLFGKCVGELLAAGATPGTVERAVRGYVQLYPQAALTPTALVKHYSAALAAYRTQRRARSTVASDHDAKVKGVPLDAILAAARGDWDEAKRLGGAL